MEKPKIYFIDIDGTLIHGYKNKKLNLDDKLAIRNAAKRETYIVLTTGRTIEDTMEIWKQIDIDKKFTSYLITNNGSTIWNVRENKIIFEDWIDKNSYEKIFDFARERKFAIKNSGEKKFYLENKILAFFLKRVLSVSNNFEDVEFNKENAKKIGIITTWRKKVVKKISLEIEEKFSELEVTISGPSLYIELNKREVSKGTAIKYLTNMLNIDLKDTVHIGDSMNDASAFRVVGRAVAMKNAMKDLKKLATHKTLTQKKCGVANTIKSFGSI